MTISRYRYRGDQIPSPWPSDGTSTQPRRMSSWRAGCGGTRTSGSEGGPRKRTGRKAGAAPRSDPNHTHASLLVGAGTPIKVVSERLGHAHPGFTMATYQHLVPGMSADAAARFADLIAAA